MRGESRASKGTLVLYAYSNPNNKYKSMYLLVRQCHLITYFGTFSLLLMSIYPFISKVSLNAYGRTSEMISVLPLIVQEWTYTSKSTFHSASSTRCTYMHARARPYRAMRSRDHLLRMRAHTPKEKRGRKKKTHNKERYI
jgi:hypothetical protein